MKKFISVNLIMLGICVISCSKQTPENVGNYDQFTAVTESSSTKTALDGVYVNWTTGDMVSINGAKYYATRKANPTNADFSYVEGIVPQQAPYWAIYPYEGAAKSGDDYAVTIPVAQTYVAGTFCTSAFPMIAISNTRTLEFKNAGAVLKITPSTSWNGIQLKQIKVSANEPLAGTATIEYDGVNAPVTTATGSTSVTLDCGNGVDFETPLFIAIAPGTYSGLTFEVTATNGGVYTKTATQSYNIERNVIAAFTLSADDIVCDLSCNIMDTPNYPTPETANTYLIKRNGSYRFPVTVRGNGVAIDSYSIDTDITGEAASAVKLFSDGSLESTTFMLSSDGDYVEFTTSNNETLLPGTAVVAVKNSSEEILWSWIIWVCPDITEKTIGGFTFLDRYLGAFKYGYSEDRHQGFYFQPGRKDPMPQRCYVEAGQTSPWIRSSISEEMDVINLSILNPFTYYDAKPWTGEFHSDLWDKNYMGIGFMLSALYEQEIVNQVNVKTMFDPSPVGYHVIDGRGGLALNNAGISYTDTEISIGSNLILPRTSTSYLTSIEVIKPISMYMSSPYSSIEYWSSLEYDSISSTNPRRVGPRNGVVLCQKAD